MKTLHTIFAELYPSELDAKRLIEQIGMNSALFDLSGSALSMWSSIISRLCDINGRLPALVGVLVTDYPEVAGQAIISYVSEKQGKGDERRIVSYDNEAQRVLHSDVRNIRADLDDLNIRLTVGLSKLEAESAHLKRIVERLDSKPDPQSNDRVILYAIIISLVILFAVYIATGLRV